MFVTNEPSAGLHPDDAAVLVDVSDRLVGHSTTVSVIEPDRDLIAAAGRILDLGPGGGDEGGRSVASRSSATVGETNRRPPLSSDTWRSRSLPGRLLRRLAHLRLPIGSG